MPFSEAGGRYRVYSPDQGVVLSGPDTIAFWQEAIAAAAGEQGTEASDALGFFPQRTTITFASSPARFEAWVTSGGGHLLGAMCMDFTAVGSGWAFLSAYRRDPAGVLTRVDSTWLTGAY